MQIIILLRPVTVSEQVSDIFILTTARALYDNYTRLHFARQLFLIVGSIYVLSLKSRGGDTVFSLAPLSVEKTPHWKCVCIDENTLTKAVKLLFKVQS